MGTIDAWHGTRRRPEFFLTISAHLMLSFGDASVDTLAYMRKQEIESLTLPQATSGDEPLTYALPPELILFFGDATNQRKPS